MTFDRTGRLAEIPALFPTLAKLDEDSATLLGNAGRRVNVPRGTVLFRAGDRCHTFLMVLDGAVRVQMASETGREIVLYRVGRGETCIVTTACLLTDKPYSAEAVAETDIDAVALAAGPFHELVARSAAFRDFVFASFGNRLTGMMMLIEEVAFGRVDLRLARFLADRRDTTGRLDTTHQALAVELGTAREVVSRQLKEFERRGFVALSRGRIQVLDPAALLALAEER
ncbi:Crp/Fnr family transcriptional regulator [Azospirillum sp. TSH7]|jgi:CRP/FNR family transcriptional regulator|uniref:Crp/Fnr family transcriptional regulator n=1 Tax=unclassified Azospirillum TaxID=2630922 RepID=UPI000D619092|nr:MULTISPECIES: Crp/Fnr family transcriptional regulator [unclassified Azospirillum]PWC57404.1 Crp/Fnr family transcriptional regulator [Azospirillum sp. TSH7]PWC60934.1 Crp/Fnr family transcriptional regulator [Azospirillum sp. TSH20]QCG92620.1 Crp/Fnr family transcriptional regulator [Azospirillum sp. TSA2s]